MRNYIGGVMAALDEAVKLSLAGSSKPAGYRCIYAVPLKFRLVFASGKTETV